jgi:hypothetical protein
MTAGWAVGLAVGAALTIVVVVLLLLMIRGASRTADRAEAIVDALHESRDNTDGVWRLDVTNQTALRIVDAAGAARSHLPTRGPRS